MKKDFFKNSNSYTISIIGVAQKQEIPYDHSVKTLNCKIISELESDNNNLVKENLSSSSNNVVEVKDNDGSDFETAIQATKIGKFNCLILFAAFWGYMSCMFTTTSMSLILPSAECDLNLSNFDKGMLNSVIYIGMTFTAFFWGLTSDAIGRRNVLRTAFALDSFFSILVGLSQNFTFLLVAKLFSGFISSGPIAILSTFLAENHAHTYRSSVIVCSGVFSSTAAATLPFLAWLIIPRQFRLVFFDGYIVLPTWRIFLLLTAVPSVMALIILSLLDESPKFLMFQGKNEEALEVFRKIYSLNTGQPKDSFPVRSLKNEMGDSQKEMNKNKMSFNKILNTGWMQIVLLLKKPHFPIALLPCVIQFFTLFGVNTVRLWSPQLFALAINKEKYVYNSTKGSTICDLLSPASGTEFVEEIVECGKHVVADKVYFNSMITGVVTGLGYLISGYIVKTVEKKWLMIATFALSISCCFGLYWSTSSNYLLGVISVFIAFTSTCATALIGAVIDIFPTSLRTTAVSLCLTFGRLGAMVGNMVFPVLLDWNCTAPFILLGVVLSLAAALTLFLPKTKGKHLQ